MSFSIAIPSGGVSSLNGLQGALTLVAGTNITITPSGSNITISAGSGSGDYQLADGTVSAPSLSFINNSNSGIYRVGSNHWGLTVAGTEALDILSSTGGFGNIGIGGSASVSDNFPLLINRTIVGGTTQFQLTNGDTTAGAGAKIQITADAGNNIVEMAAYTAATASPDSYAGGRGVVRANGDLVGLSLIADMNSSADVRLYAGGNAITNRVATANSSGLSLGVAGSLGGVLNFQGLTSGTLTQEVPSVVTSYIVKWPSAQGSASTVLTNDGAGNLSWEGVLPSPLEALASYTPNVLGTLGSFVGNISDSDQTNLQVVFGSTDTAVAAHSTSNVDLIAGNNTAASATGNGGSVNIYSGSIVTSGTGSGGDITLNSGSAIGGFGGSIVLNSGNSTSQQGGGFSFTGGSGGTQGGNISFTGGNGGSSTGGQISLVAGDSTGAGGGLIQLTTGHGSGASRGTILFQNGSEGTAGYVWASTDASGTGTWVPSNKAPIRIVTTTATLSASTDCKVVVNASSGAVSINLPAGVDGLNFKIVRAATDAGTWTITPNGGDTLDANIQTNFNANNYTPITFKTGKWYLI